MTTLLVHSEHAPLAVHLSSLTQMTSEQFCEFCQANSKLRIERAATGEVIIMPPACSDTGNRSSKINQQLTNWADQDGTGFTLTNGATRSPDAWIRSDRWNTLSDRQKASFAPVCPDFVI